MVEDYAVLLMKPKCGVFIFQKLLDFLQNLEVHYYSCNSPPARLWQARKINSHPSTIEDKNLPFHNLQKILLGNITQNGCPDLRWLIHIHLEFSLLHGISKENLFPTITQNSKQHRVQCIPTHNP